MNYLFVCPTCGDAWYRFKESGTEWMPLRSACEFCPPGIFQEMVPGSILNSLPYSTLSRLEGFDLRREFFVHLRLIEKELANASSNERPVEQGSTEAA
jgi:hypothetical protein